MMQEPVWKNSGFYELSKHVGFSQKFLNIKKKKQKKKQNKQNKTHFPVLWLKKINK